MLADGEGSNGGSSEASTDTGDATASDTGQPSSGGDTSTGAPADADSSSSGDIELPPLCLQSWTSELLTSSIFADTDGDGREELWQSYPVEPLLSVLRASEFVDGEAVLIAEIEVPDTLVRLADVDGDGMVDLLGRSDDQARWYPSESGLDFGEAIDLDWDGPWSWTWTDIDGDGDDDMIVLDVAPARLTAVRNDSGVLVPLSTAELEGSPSDGTLFEVYPLDDGRLIASVGAGQQAEHAVVYEPSRGIASSLVFEGFQPHLLGAAYLDGASQVSLLVHEGGQVAAYADGLWSRSVIVDQAVFAGFGRFTDTDEPQLLYQPTYDDYLLRDLGTGTEQTVELQPGSVATTVRGAAELDGRPQQEVVMYECGFACYVGFGKLEPCAG